MVAPSVPPPQPAAKSPRARAARRLTRRWDRQRAAPKPVDQMTLPELLLYAQTISPDEGPGADMLGAVLAVLDEWINFATCRDRRAVRVTVTDLVLLSHKIEAAAELVRRGAGAMPIGG